LTPHGYARTSDSARRVAEAGREQAAHRARDLQGPNRVAITDGKLTAIYAPIDPIPEDRKLGYVADLGTDAIKILPHYTEAGWDCVANVVALTDGARKAIFVPVEPVRLA